MANPLFAFTCIIFDSDGMICDYPYFVEMERGAKLFKLARELLQASSFDPATYMIALWRPKTSISAVPTRLSERIKSLKPFEDEGETESLNEAMTVDQFCTAYQPREQDINILALLLPRGRKRSRTEFEERSTTAYLSSQRIANDRPTPDLADTPIALLYHGFGRFLDHVHGQDGDGVNDRTLEAQVCILADAMCKYYPDENTRQDTALPLVNDIFRCHPSSCELDDLEAGLVYGDRASNGHASGPTGAIEVIIQVKNELGTTRCDPEVQLAAHYSQSLVVEHSTELRSNFLSPALGIALLGGHVGFYALAFIRGRTRIVSLTPLLRMAIDVGNTWARTALLRAFQAACVLRSHIHKDAEEFHNGIRRYLVSRNLPYVNQVHAWPATLDGTNVEFDIVKSEYKGPSMHPDRFLYSAKVQGLNKPVVVKFARSYFLPLHDFCAERGHAPKVLGYKEDHVGEYRDVWSRDLRKLVGEFHEKGWVHGDLRVANFIVSKDRPEQIMLIDFDWGGDLSVGKVRYPTSLLIGDLVDPRDPLNLDITKERDKRVLASALAEW
ncbi:hypothetical protein BC834DRAFT_971273 [Gloeopeniophorella convolvens]|nr:hypothetical protein BC834DRAFT_971273 [Gloeopeniophorella convolvens]